MNQFPHPHPVNDQHVEAVARRFFPAKDIQVERVMSGVTNYVYRIKSQSQVYYLRIAPEEEASFAPEIAALAQLRQQQVRIPEVIHAEDYNNILGRPLMIETEIKGVALSKSFLPAEIFDRIAMEAGRDLARINQLPVDGFGWLKVHPEHPTRLYGESPTFHAFALASRAADLAYLSKYVLDERTITAIEHALNRYDAKLDIPQAYLAHGDFDTTHIFQDDGQYTGIIDFGEVRGAGPVYDLAHFRIRDDALPAYPFFSALERGYQEITPPPPDYEQRLRFTSVLINIRALSRAFQTRLPDEFIWHQLAILQEDIAALA